MNYPANVTTRLARFLYNLDRAGASLFGAPPQETISSQAGRAAARGKWWGRAMSAGLNWIQAGHTTHAIEHADKLNAVDDGFEG